MTTLDTITLRSTTAKLRHRVRVGAELVWWVTRWAGRHRRYLLAWSLVALLAGQTGATRVQAGAVLAVLVPAFGAAVWARRWPSSYERLAAGPARRLGWRRWARRQWPSLARECGLSVQRPHQPWWLLLTGSSGRPSRSAWGRDSMWAHPQGRVHSQVWVHPRLMEVSTAGNTLTSLIRARRGQTVEDLEKAAAALGASASAVSWRCKPLTPSVLEVVLVMREQLDTAALATAPQGVVDVDAVRLGRRQDGTPWHLRLRGRHTLVVGCSGSGKGSILWGVCGGLAPAVKADLVRLWGIDLKKGVEVGMGRALFSVTADDPATALTVLTRLLEVIDERGRRMAGVTRLHEPVPRDPLHVLVIDELADLIGYSDADTKREATRLLSTILTQGRALGVVVLACVQDPRKDTVTMRGLFTQTLALRLRSAEETRMVLGDGMAALAPAHRISPACPGTAWVVEDDGTVDRVRAAYWPDTLIRGIAATYSAPVVQPVDDEPVPVAAVPVALSTARKPRTPRAPRLPRSSQDASGPSGGEAA